MQTLGVMKGSMVPVNHGTHAISAIRTVVSTVDSKKHALVHARQTSLKIIGCTGLHPDVSLCRTQFFSEHSWQISLKPAATGDRSCKPAVAFGARYRHQSSPDTQDSYKSTRQQIPFERKQQDQTDLDN